MEDDKLEGGASRHVRIFVGGLGSAVTSSDLEKTFSTLGKVTGVEIIRTKGRHICYMDFEPSSDKALAKLFSMYNGCIWKGGRLKLEKAKEHYLNRLKREWAEDAELMSGVHEEINSDKDVSLSEKSMVATMEKKQLHIFFPKLRKLKSLPYSGTGKHKYSFQRIEVPSLPVHFCDCEEHSGHSATAVEKLVSSINGGINEKELNIMNSVMNKLLGREVESEVAAKATIAESQSTIENRSNHVINEAPLKDEEIDESSDEDNLLLNIATAGNSSRLNLRQLPGMTSSSVGKEYVKDRIEPSNGRTASRRSDHQDAQNILNSRPKKKARRKMVIQSTENEFTAIDTDTKVKTNIEDEFASRKDDDNAVSGNSSTCTVDIQLTSNIIESIQGLSYSQKSSWKELVGESSKKVFSLSDINTHEPMAQHEAQKGTQSKSEAEQPSNSRTWMQKSSWKDLVGQTSNTLFSISDIVPSVKQNLSIKSSKPSMKKQQQAVTDEGKKLEEGKMDILGQKVFTVSGSNAESSGKGQETQLDGAKQAISKENHQNEGDRNLPKESKANGVEEKKGKDAVGIGEVCSFMRSAASEREWMKAKAALSSSLKKKSGEDSATKSSKSSSNRNFRGGTK